MDISELPFYVGVLVLLVAFVAVFVTAKRLTRRWLRWRVRGGAGVGMALTVLSLALFVVGDYSCTARAPLAYSADCKHVAVLTWGLQGALGSDIATVKVRHRYSPFAKTVYSGSGWSDSPDLHDTNPQVRWIDNKHLIIRYYEFPGYEQVCAPHALGIEVVCEHLPSHFVSSSQYK